MDPDPGQREGYDRWHVRRGERRADTGGRARLPGIEVCGKTGSAQLASNEYVKGAGGATRT